MNFNEKKLKTKKWLEFWFWTVVLLMCAVSIAALIVSALGADWKAFICGLVLGSIAWYYLIDWLVKHRGKSHVNEVPHE